MAHVTFHKYLPDTCLTSWTGAVFATLEADVCETGCDCDSGCGAADTLVLQNTTQSRSETSPGHTPAGCFRSLNSGAKIPSSQNIYSNKGPMD